ncbi:4Fe-4S dicluster domain-containing protein [Thiospirochaeta perfilievii]|uniref:4Fe-4S dicluster domain-containing protein n=1 Tax=Thiospirochaeta perfilievii TaxID=252967 RepID=A0A5C1QED8_9SPIO|nr:4Fe-4S dicluster domain-containing protein [Thiospirochaeta perfilievii]QEN05349.1 4Fe-4S dicluster domain-containing protein [Thiospirochaeta perfilievii]
MKLKAINQLRTVIEVFFLVFFIGLTINNKLQLWFGIFLIGTILSTIIGRYYCGWICPMNTLFRPIDFIYRKFKIKRLKPPVILSKTWLRYLFLILFVVSMVAVRVIHIKINILLYVVILSVFITLFIEESFWHKAVCPFGTILSLTSRKSTISMNIDENNCISCGKCQKVCPSESISTKENKKRFNLKQECLMCYQCIEACPVKVCNITK